MANSITHIMDADRFISASGGADGASIYFYYSGTTNLAPIYADTGLVTPMANPVVVAVGAIIPSIYLVSGLKYRRRVVHVSDGSVADTDPLTSTNQTPFPSLYSYGATGNGTTNDTAAVSAADAVAGKDYSPKGVFKTTLASTALKGPFWGEGQIKDAANNLRAPFFSAISSRPAALGNLNSIETAFNGDVSNIQFPIEHRISGASTLGQPLSGYLYTNEAYPVLGYLINQSGWNQSTSGNGGRTAAAFSRVKVDNYGQGDCVAYNATAFVASAKAGATHFLANPAISLFNGDMNAGISGAYLNPYEIHLSDGGFDVACVGHVMNFNRTNATGALSCWWGGVRVQSVGSAAVNNILSATGKFNTGIDLSMSFLDFGSNKAAISLKQGDRIYFNNAASDDVFTTSFNGDYITYSSGINALNFVVAGTSILQVGSAQLTSTVTTVVPNLRVNAATIASGAGQLAFGTTTATTATAGASGTVPAQVLGYLVASLNGTNIKIPYYSN